MIFLILPFIIAWILLFISLFITNTLKNAVFFLGGMILAGSTAFLIHMKAPNGAFIFMMVFGIGVVLALIASDNWGLWYWIWFLAGLIFLGSGLIMFIINESNGAVLQTPQFWINCFRSAKLEYFGHILFSVGVLFLVLYSTTSFLGMEMKFLLRISTISLIIGSMLIIADDVLEAIPQKPIAKTL